MPSKILANNSSANIEAELSGYDTTNLFPIASHVVNPTQGTVGKIVIINLPIDSDLELVCRRNKVISRFPLKLPEGVKYDLVPYPEVDYKIDKNHQPYSNMILNKWMLLDPDYVVSLDDRYLLAIDPITEDYVNCIGYLLLNTIKH
jgi:hypothetical protein